jgi:hypothetical protein
MESFFLSEIPNFVIWTGIFVGALIVGSLIVCWFSLKDDLDKKAKQEENRKRSEQERRKRSEDYDRRRNRFLTLERILSELRCVSDGSQLEKDLLRKLDDQDLELLDLNEWRTGIRSRLDMWQDDLNDNKKRPILCDFLKRKIEKLVRKECSL